MNIYKTAIMLAAIEQLNKRKTFLRDRYFPTNESADIFPSEDVLIEIKKGNRKIAPCVLPRKGGISIEREGYKTARYTPPTIAPQRPLTIDDLNKKGFGENLFENKTPEQRQAEILRLDLEELDEMISGREENIASQALFSNSIILKQYADKYGSGEYSEFEIRFYEGENDDTKYTPSISWSNPNADILADLKIMIRILTSKGLPASDLVVSPDVADVILNNQKLQKLLDNRNINIGNITPLDLPDGASHIGKLNVYGKMLDIISYDETYEDEDGKTKQFVPEGQVLLTAPACGRGLYGAVTQIEEVDGNFHTYMGKRVPKCTSDAKAEIRNLKITSRPLLIPRNYNSWVHSKVVF